MENTPELSSINFHGDTIYFVVKDGQPYVPMKRIVENLGLGWGSQRQKIMDNKQRWGVTMIVIPSSGGNQEMLCIHLRKFPSYMSSINANKVNRRLRDKIVLYQNECDEALWHYWIDGEAIRKDVKQEAHTMTAKEMLLAGIIPDGVKTLTPNSALQYWKASLHAAEIDKGTTEDACAWFVAAGNWNASILNTAKATDWLSFDLNTSSNTLLKKTQ